MFYQKLFKLIHLIIIKTESSAATNHIIPWQYDLQLNLETWKQIAKTGDIEKTNLIKNH